MKKLITLIAISAITVLSTVNVYAEDIQELNRELVVTNNNRFDYKSYEYNYDFQYDFGKLQFDVKNNGYDIYVKHKNFNDVTGNFPNETYSNYGAIKNSGIECFDNIGDDIKADDPEYVNYINALSITLNYDFIRTIAETPSTINWDLNNEAILNYNGVNIKAKLTTDKSGKPAKIDYTLMSNEPQVLTNILGNKIIVNNLQASTTITSTNIEVPFYDN